MICDRIRYVPFSVFDVWSSESDDSDAMFVPSDFFTAEDMYGYPEEEESL